MKMTDKTFRAAAMLYQGATVGEVAQDVGVSEATVRRWCCDVDFKKALCDMAAASIGDLVPVAVATIRDVLADTTAKPETRLKAAGMIIDYSHIAERQELNRDISVKVEYV